VKSVIVNGKSFKLGRLTPKTHVRMHLKDYLRLKDLPTPPTSVDWSSNAAAALAQMYLNDQLGDCVIAGLMHLQGVWTGNANPGQPFIATDAQVIAAYSAIGGYVPGDAATDQGCDESTALQYAQTTGVGDGTKFAGSAGIDGTNQLECQQALSLFEGGVMFGIALPDAWVNPTPSASGFTWDVAGDPDPENGHCVVGVGYSADGIIISTWGMLGTITWAAVAKYATAGGGGELWAALSPDQIATGQAKAPNGLDWGALQSDFQLIAGATPAPAPTPDPTPTPAGPTLAQAQQACAAALQQLWSGS
jgi:hypothetical protein